MPLFQSNLQKQIRNLPKNLNFVKIIHYYSKLFIGVLSEVASPGWAERLHKDYSAAYAPREKTDEAPGEGGWESEVAKFDNRERCQRHISQKTGAVVSTLVEISQNQSTFL